VAIEPVSNFILLEQYEAKRDAETWRRVFDERLAGMPITVVQVTSDLAKALVHHAEVYLGVHHSPDLFHVQHDTVKATGAALAGQTRRAEQRRSEAQAAVVVTRVELEYLLNR
jgi:ribosome-binding factor A